MGKFLLVLSVICLLFLEIGTSKSPDDTMFWLASSSMLFQVVRNVIIVFLIVHLLTRPPRHTWFRFITGIVAITTFTWAIQATFAFTMPLMDTLAFLTASIALMIAAIERSSDYVTEDSLKSETVLKSGKYSLLEG